MRSRSMVIGTAVQPTKRQIQNTSDDPIAHDQARQGAVMGAVVPASTDRRGDTLNETQIHKTVRSGCDAGNTIKHNPLQTPKQRAFAVCPCRRRSRVRHRPPTAH